MGGPTKDELIGALKDEFGIEADPKSTNAELQAELNAAREGQHIADLSDADGFGAHPGDAVMYVLTADHAAWVTKREARYARFVKAIAPFTPRVYSEGDAVYGRVFSSYDDGTADIDLLGSFPRVTLERVPVGYGAGHYQKRG